MVPENPHRDFARRLRMVYKASPTVAADAGNVQSVTQALEALPLGFSTGDPQLDRAAKILRLLYVADLRQTQNHVNEAISRMQQYTCLLYTTPSSRD